MKKLMALVLILALALSLAGCGNSASGDETAGGAAQGGGAAAADGDWPSKTIQMVIPFGAGGDTDLHCRVLTDLVAAELGVDIVSTNVTGTSGTIAARQVKDSAADGYTVLWHQTSFLIASLLGVSEFDYSDFATACTVIEDKSSFIATNAGNEKFRDFDEMVAYAKANPGDILVGASIGGDAHLYFLILADALDIEVTYVDLDGTNEIIPALLNNDVDIAMGIYGTYKEYLNNGDFTGLVYLGEECPEDAGIPTWLSISGEEFPIGKMFGYWFPEGTPQSVIDAFNEAVATVSASDEWKAHCAAYYIDPVFRGGGDAVAYLDEQYALMGNYKDALVVD